MITIRKLKSLPPRTRLRKIVTLLEDWERKLVQGDSVDRLYYRQILELLLEEPDEAMQPYHAAIQNLIFCLRSGFSEQDEKSSPAIQRNLHHLRYGFMNSLGIVPADWDFYHPRTGEMYRNPEMVLPAGLYLDDIRSPYNVGSIFRTAEAFGIEKIYLSRYTASPTHKRALRTSMGCTLSVPWETVELEHIAASQTLFALELGGDELGDFHFPERGVAVIGSEELGISPEARKLARQSGGIVSIPLRGAKASLNVSVAVGVLLNAWTSSIAAAQT